MPPRSRRTANILARERLQQARIGDEDVLDVLRIWYFKQNKTRCNVFPAGATSVNSDTLGGVRTRTGTVVLTRITTKYLAAFNLLCRWLAENAPSTLKNFAYSSINLNYGYAARRHRDANNVGPSITKSFGQFTGGLLLYWPFDDGQSDINDFVDSAALTIDTHREMVLFDGPRCHTVTPFQGERYSVVFFTAPKFEKMRADSIRVLQENGATWPSETSQRHFQNLIGPPTGSSNSIRVMFGYEEKAAAIQCAGTPITKLPTDALLIILSYQLSPMTMAVTCSLSMRFRDLSWTTAAWARSVVDASRVRPVGHKALGHYRLLLQARHVVSGPWASANVGVLMSKDFAVWTWYQYLVESCGMYVCVSQSPVRRSVTVRTDSAVGMVIGMSTSKEPRDIISSMRKASRKRAFYGAFMNEETIAFLNNGKVIHLGDSLNYAGERFVTITLAEDSLELRFDVQSYSLHIPKGETNTDKETYGAVVMETRRGVNPCWTAL